MSIEAKMIALIALIAAAYAGYAFVDHRGAIRGRAEVHAKWDADTAARTKAENTAILAQLKNNERIAEQQEIDRQRITKAHHDELAQVRADIARAPRLRIGPALCGGFAASAEAKSAGRSDGADPGSGLVREDVGRNIDALKLRVEEAFAAGRACQAFVVSAGAAAGAMEKSNIRAKAALIEP